MTNINIVYDEEFEDADIICIPDHIYYRLMEIVNEFLDWLPNAPKNNEDYWCSSNDGKFYQILETKGFVQWLNEKYCQEGEETKIVEQNCKYNPEYKTIEW